MIDSPRLFSNSFPDTDTICFAILPLLEYANNLFTEDDWETTRPIRLRSIGSRTDDKAEVMRRLALIVEFAKKQNKYARDNGKCVTDYYEYTQYAQYARCASNCAALYAQFATESADCADCAEATANYAAETANYAAQRTTNRAEWYAMTRDDLINLFDQCFPKITEPQQAHIDRAKRLHELSSPEMTAPLRRAQESVKEEK